MIANPKQGQRVRLVYAAFRRQIHEGFYGLCGVVEVVGHGKPRNHGVRLDDGGFVVVPCGHLAKEGDGR